MLIEASNAAFGYGGRSVIRVEQVCIDRGQCLGVFGPNGSGKSTLVRGLIGLMPPLDGRVRVPIRDESRGARRRSAMRIGYLPQQRAIQRHWPMSALDAAVMAGSLHTRMGWINSTWRLRTIDQLRSLDVAALATKPFAQLSGGQQQRVLLAGVLATEPDLIVLDESIEGLDRSSRAVVLSTLRNAKVQGLAAIMISHDPAMLTEICDHIAWVHTPAGDPICVSSQMGTLVHASEVELVPASELLPRLAGDPICVSSQMGTLAHGAVA